MGFKINTNRTGLAAIGIDGEWYYGKIQQHQGGFAMVWLTKEKDFVGTVVNIKPETICRFTMFWDNDGRDIYENDTLEVRDKINGNIKAEYAHVYFNYDKKMFMVNMGDYSTFLNDVVNYYNVRVNGNMLHFRGKR